MKTIIPVSNQFDTMCAVNEVKHWFDSLWEKLRNILIYGSRKDL